MPFRPATGLRESRIREVTKASRRAARNYVPQSFNRRVTHFRTSMLMVPPVLERIQYPWEKLCLDGVEIHEPACDHWSVLREPNVRSDEHRVGNEGGSRCKKCGPQ